jgi:hypothetical protein
MAGGTYLANINLGLPFAEDDFIFPSFHGHGAGRLQHSAGARGKKRQIWLLRGKMAATLEGYYD